MLSLLQNYTLKEHSVASLLERVIRCAGKNHMPVRQPCSFFLALDAIPYIDKRLSPWCLFSKHCTQTCTRAESQLWSVPGGTAFISGLFLDTCQVPLQQPFSHFLLAHTFKMPQCARCSVCARPYFSVCPGRAGGWL